MAKGKIVFLILSAVVIVAAAFGGNYIHEYSSYLRAIEAIEIGELDLSETSDGTYSGFYDATWVSARVEVTVKDQRITNIGLDHDHDQGEAAEVIPGRVIEAQSLQVDTVSGATNSCLVILKAIENALNLAE